MLSQVCEDPVGCFPEAVVPSSKRNNIVKLRLPTEMSDITSATTHTITITSRPIVGGLTLESDGARGTGNDRRGPRAVLACVKG